MTIEEYWQMFTDVWKLFKRYCNPVKDQDFWNGLINDSGRICRRYENNKLAVTMIVECQREIERIFKAREKK